MELDEKKAQIARSKSAQLEVRFIRSGERLRITNNGPSRARDLRIRFPNGTDTQIVPGDELDKHFPVTLERGESVTAYTVISVKTPLYTPMELRWRDELGQKVETRKLEPVRDPANIQVNFDRTGPNSLTLKVGNEGPLTAKNVEVIFPGREPILMPLEGQAKAEELKAGEYIEFDFMQYLEHETKTVYQIQVRWIDILPRHQEFNVVFPRR